MNAGNVFRAYDIRGVVDKDFNAEWVTHLGKACGTYLAGRGISSAVIGYDCRHSSPAYHDALVEGILSTGTDVISIGMVPTPALYFAVKHLNRQGGVMITASHNPPEYNGFKVWAGQSTIHGEEIQKIKAIFEEGAFAEGTGDGFAHRHHPHVQARYPQPLQAGPPGQSGARRRQRRGR